MRSIYVLLACIAVPSLNCDVIDLVIGPSANNHDDHFLITALQCVDDTEARTTQLHFEQAREIPPALVTERLAIPAFTLGSGFWLTLLMAFAYSLRWEPSSRVTSFDASGV